MTAEIPEDPYEGLPTTSRVSGRLVRDLTGVLLIALGVVVLVIVLATVDVRLAWALAALVMVSVGFALGRSSERS